LRERRRPRKGSRDGNSFSFLLSPFLVSLYSHSFSFLFLLSYFISFSLFSLFLIAMKEKREEHKKENKGGNL